LRVYNKLILTIALAFSAITVLLASLRQGDIAIYFIGDAVAFLVITLLYTYLNPRARGALNSLSAVIFIGFLAIATLKVIEILR
jgi:hypothetical protein